MTFHILRFRFRFQALDTFNLHLVMVISGMMLAISSILPYCYYASRMSYTINMNADHAYQSNWYLFTIDQQRSLQMILAHSQIKRNFTGYDIIDCSLEVFLMVYESTTIRFCARPINKSFQVSFFCFRFRYSVFRLQKERPHMLSSWKNSPANSSECHSDYITCSSRWIFIYCITSACLCN